MANFPASLPQALTDQLGAATNRLIPQGWPSFTLAAPWLAAAPAFLNVKALQPPNLGGPHTVVPPGQKVQLPRVDRTGAIPRTLAEDWFEKFHVVPRSIELGEILGTVQVGMEVFNSDRELPHDWDAFTNNVDNGVAIIDLPALPITLQRLQGSLITFEATVDGPAVVDGTLDFQVDFPVDPTTIKVEVTGNRIVMFHFRPERPMTERLEFLTDILVHTDGTEQRIALRKNPRQIFELLLRLEDGVEQQLVNNTLFEWQPRVFGLPMWHEPTRLTSDVAVDDITINVESTAFADYRVGSLAVIFESTGKFDALKILSFTATTITFESPVMSAYTVASGAVQVMPMRTAVLDENLTGRRFPVGLEELRVRLRVTDNDSDLADTSAFSTFNSKVLLDDFNAISGTLPRSLRRKILKVDGETGIFTQKSLWNRSRAGSAKMFAARTRQRVWEVRRLLHALKGQQVSFYLPTFFNEITAASQFFNGSALADIVNVGYTRFVQSRQPRNVIRVELNDGTILVRTVLSSTVTSPTVEQLTLDTTWPQDIFPSDIFRIDFLEKVRLDSDSVSLNHRSALGEADVSFPVRAVTE